MTKRAQKPSRDLHQEVTEAIIEELEAGVAPWVKPWEGGEPLGLPRSAATGRSYSGINVVFLWTMMLKRGYTDPRWITFNQAKKKGGSVKKGQKSTPVIFWKMVEAKDDEGNVRTNEDGSPKFFSFMRSFNAFSVHQIEGLEDYEPPVDETDLDALIKGTEADIWPSMGRAAYWPAADHITMPSKESFADEGAYYATVLHELVHWTGAEHRLDREQGSAFGTPEYAYEELVAELGSAFLCAEFGIEGLLQHPSYIEGWLSLLKGDKKVIFKAAADAAKAAKFIVELGAEG